VAEEQIPLDPKKRDALFRKFAEYQRTLGPDKATIRVDSNRCETLFRGSSNPKQRRVIVACHDTAADH
jgi:hypothetical protein